MAIMIWMSSICAGIQCFVVYSSVFGCRPGNTVFYVLWCVIWELAIHGPLSSQLTALLFPLLSVVLFWKKALTDKVMTSLMVFSLLFLSHLTAVITGRLLDCEIPLVLFVMTWAAAALLTILYLLFGKYASNLRSSWWIVLAAVPAALILVTADSYSLFHSRFGVESLMILTLLIVVVVGCMQLMETQKNKEKEQLLIQTRNEELASRYDLLQIQYLTSFQTLHDTLHHCRSIEESLQQADIEQARKKLNEYAGQVTESFHRQYTTSPVMNALLLERKEQLQKSHIQIRVQWDNAAVSHISLLTLTDLMSLLLDTAISQCRQSQGGSLISIKAGIHEQKKILSIQCPALIRTSPFETQLPQIRKYCQTVFLKPDCYTLTCILGLDLLQKE